MTKNHPVVSYKGVLTVWLFTARNVLDNILGLQKLDDIFENLLRSFCRRRNFPDGTIILFVF